MTLTLDLPEPLEQELVTEAAQLGFSLSEYILHVLMTKRLLANKPKTGAEFGGFLGKGRGHRLATRHC